MNLLPKPRVLGRVSATSKARPGDLRVDSTATEMNDLLAVWLAEVSAEATLQGSADEPASTAPEPTD
jgi:hypothetical protein